MDDLANKKSRIFDSSRIRDFLFAFPDHEKYIGFLSSSKEDPQGIQNNSSIFHLTML